MSSKKQVEACSLSRCLSRHLTILQNQCVCDFRILFQPTSRHGFVMCLSISGRRNRSWSDTICIPDVMLSCIEGASVLTCDAYIGRSVSGSSRALRGGTRRKRCIPWVFEILGQSDVVSILMRHHLQTLADMIFVVNSEQGETSVATYQIELRRALSALFLAVAW